MKKGKIFNVPYKRKKQGKTYYKRRLKLLLSSKSRFVVRKSLRNLQVSIIDYGIKGDKVLFTVNSNTLNKLGWDGGNGNLPSAYLVGLLAGKKALELGIRDAVLDLGFNKSTKGSRLYAALAGALDAGFNIPVNQEVLPSKDRILGEHIVKYAQALKNDEPKYNKQFSRYNKKGIKPEDIAKHFAEIKAKIYGQEKN